MSFDTPASTEEQAVKQAQIGIMASKIRNNKHFHEILKTCTPFLRKDVYEEISPYLTFKPKPYWLMKF